MWYKEWRLARYKMALALLVFGLFAVLQAKSSCPMNITLLLCDSPDPGFVSWMGLSLPLSLIAGLLVGINALSSEVENNTLSFLLTRPVSREHIFLAKLGVNLLTLLPAVLLANLYVFIADQPHPITTDPSQAFGLVLLTLIVAVASVCLSVWLSLLTRSLLQTIAAVIVVLVVVFTGWMFIDANSYSMNWDIERPAIVTLMPYSVPACALLAFAAFALGLRTFRRKVY